jgi:hypothetical protein
LAAAGLAAAVLVEAGGRVAPPEFAPLPALTALPDLAVLPDLTAPLLLDFIVPLEAPLPPDFALGDGLAVFVGLAAPADRVALAGRAALAGRVPAGLAVLVPLPAVPETRVPPGPGTPAAATTGSGGVQLRNMMNCWPSVQTLVVTQ